MLCIDQPIAGWVGSVNWGDSPGNTGTIPSRVEVRGGGHTDGADRGDSDDESRALAWEVSHSLAEQISRRRGRQRSGDWRSDEGMMTNKSLRGPVSYTSLEDVTQAFTIQTAQSDERQQECVGRRL